MSEYPTEGTVDQYQFISGLSKSLQALCHGCMDFDCDIEIIGYININIDRGNKVDCVLNERVLKNQNKHTTFVSNSFLAEKKQLKQTCDQSSSTSHQDPQKQSFPSAPVTHEQGHYQNPSLQEPLHTSFRSQTVSDTKKRYSHEREVSPSKVSFEESQQQVLFSNCSNQFESNLPSFHGSKAVSQSEMFSTYNDPQTNDAAHMKHEIRETINPFSGVKNDGSKPHDSVSYESTEGKSHTEIMELSGWNRGVYSLLEKMYYNQHMSDSYKKHDSGEASAEQSCSKVQDGGGKVETSFPYDHNPGKSNNEHLPSDFTYLQTNSLGIDEMYGGARVKMERTSPIRPKKRPSTSPVKSRKNRFLKTDSSRSSLECHLCGEVATSRFYFSQHMAEAHSEQLPFHCVLCGKGFVSSSGLRHHKQTHKGQSFACGQCHRRFTHKHHLRDHEKRTGHNLFSFKTEQLN